MKSESDELAMRLNAHREILIQLVASMLSKGHDVDEQLLAPSGDLSVLDQEEDPGVVPGEAYAAQARFAAEMRSILEAATKRAEAMKN